MRLTALDRYALIAGVAIQAWALWGIPAERNAAFAFGIGLAVVPMIRIARKALEQSR